MSHARLSVLDWQRNQDNQETDPTWSSREHPGGVKLTGDLRDENTGHLERAATKRRDSLGTKLIYSLMFLDNNNLRSCSPPKNVKRLFK